MTGNDTNDSTYTNLQSQLQSIGSQRNALAAQMIQLLEGAEFNGQPFSDAKAQSLITQGQALLNQMNALPH